MIIFNYTISDIFTEAKTLCQYYLSTMPDEQEESFEKMMIVDRDEDMLKVYLKTVSAKIAQIISGYSKYLYDTDNVTLLSPFEFDVTYSTVEHSIVFRVNMPDTFDTNKAIMLDDSIKNALVNYILFMFFKKKKLDFTVSFDDYGTALSEIRTYIHSRVQSTHRNYNTLL